MPFEPTPPPAEPPKAPPANAPAEAKAAYQSELLKYRVKCIMAGTGMTPGGHPIPKLAQGQLSRYAGISTGAVSQWLAGKYAASTRNIERKMADVIKRFDDPNLSPLADSPESQEDAWFENNIVKRIHGTFRQAVKNRFLCGIISEPGMGKTIASRMFVREHPTFILIELNRAMGGGTPSGIMDAFFRFIDTAGYNPKLDRKDVWLCNKFAAGDRLIVIDNAEMLNANGLDWVLGFYERTKSPMALIGNDELHMTLRKVQRAPSRVYPLVDLDFKQKRDDAARMEGYISVSAGEFLAAHWTEHAEDPEMIKLARTILQHRGRMRSLEKLITTARGWYERDQEKSANEREFRDPASALRAAMARHIVDYKLNV